MLFAFQIYLFSQVQGDLEHARTETFILVRYLEMLYQRSRQLIEKAIGCLCQRRQPLENILVALQNSILHQLLPFVMTCLYVGSLDDDIMITADNQISDLVGLWTNFLTIAKLSDDVAESDDNKLQTALFSKAYSSQPSSGSAWYFSLLYILVAADSRYITGLAPAVVPLTSQDELLLVWSRSYIFSGGLASNLNHVEDYAFLHGLYTGKDAMWKVVFAWMEVRARAGLEV